MQVRIVWAVAAATLFALTSGCDNSPASMSSPTVHASDRPEANQPLATMASPVSSPPVKAADSPMDEQKKRGQVEKVLNPIFGRTIDGIIVVPPKSDEGWNVMVDLVSHLDRKADIKRTRSVAECLLNSGLDIRDVLSSAIYKRAEPNDITTVYAIQASRNGQKRNEGKVQLVVVTDGPYPSIQ